MPLLIENIKTILDGCANFSDFLRFVQFLSSRQGVPKVVHFDRKACNIFLEMIHFYIYFKGESSGHTS